MRYIRYAILAALTIVLVSVALANRETVVLELLPSGLAELAGQNWSVALPQFVVIFGGVAAGLLVGFVWEWIREHKHRRVASQSTRQARQLEREVNRLKTERNKDKDEVLAILDEAG
ncbi:MAG: LapA family protein [Rhodobacteraceae bacterium]|nr:LapA family protein [Paracoccaceae bacterium]